MQYSHCNMLVRTNNLPQVAMPTPAGLREDVRALDKWVRAPERYGFHTPPTAENVAAELRQKGPEEETLRDAAHLAEAFQANGKSPEPFVSIVADWQNEGLIAGPQDLTQRILTERVPVHGTSVGNPEVPEFSPVATQYIPKKTGLWHHGEEEAKAYSDLCKSDPALARQIFPALIHQSGMARGEEAGRQLMGYLFEQSGKSEELKAVMTGNLPLLLSLIPEAESRGCLNRPKVDTPDSIVSPSTGWVQLFRGLATLTPLDEKFMDTQVKPFLESPDSDWRFGAVCFLTQQLPEHPELAKYAEKVLYKAETDKDRELLEVATQQGWRADAAPLVEALKGDEFNQAIRTLGSIAEGLDAPTRQKIAAAVLARQDVAAQLCDPDPPSASTIHPIKAFEPELKELVLQKLQDVEPEQLLQDATLLGATALLGLEPSELGTLRPLLVEGRSEPKEARAAVDRVRDYLLSQGGTPRELMMLNLGRADCHVNLRQGAREMAIQERILELAGELPEGPAPTTPLKDLSVTELVDMALNPPAPEALADQLAEHSQSNRLKVACAGLQLKIYQNALNLLNSDAPPPQRLKAWRSVLVAIQQGGLRVDGNEAQDSWLSGFPDLSRWGDDRWEVANELAGASPDRASLDRHHARLERLLGQADEALKAYRQLRETCSSEEQLEAATARMARLQQSFREDALSLSAFVEGLEDPQAAIGPFCLLYGELRDLPAVESSFRRGHAPHLEHLLRQAKDPEITLKAWKGILPRLEAGETYESVWFAELGLALGLAKGSSSTVGLGEQSVTVGGVRLPTRRRS